MLNNLCKDYKDYLTRIYNDFVPTTARIQERLQEIELDQCAAAEHAVAYARKLIARQILLSPGQHAAATGCQLYCLQVLTNILKLGYVWKFNVQLAG